ncbi:MAG: hypothetical protein IJ662_07250 [Clostridia bacterium]|nr:hypothetical protein [Clostridia bacterium]
MNVFSYDLLIIGSAAPALQALGAARYPGKIAVLADSDTAKTPAASGEMNARLLMETGCFHSDPALVRVLCDEAGKQTEHAPAHADALPGCALRLYAKNNQIQGALGFDRGQFFLVAAPRILLCGGENGSALTMAYYAGARLADLEFQFQGHPLGGMIIDAEGCATVRGLYAAGCWCAGLHGAAYQAPVAAAAEEVFACRAARNIAATQMQAGVDLSALESWGEETAHVGAARIADSIGEIRRECAPAAEQLRFPYDEAMLETALQAVSHAQHELNELPPAAPEEAFLRLREEDWLIALRLHVFSAMERRDTLGCFVRGDYPNGAAAPYRVCMGLQGLLLWPEKEAWPPQHDARNEA